MTRRARGPLSAAAVVVCGLLLAGCGGGGGSSSPSAGSSSSSSGSSSGSSSANGAATASADPTAYASVLPGTRLTAAGSRVRFGDDVTAAWTPSAGSVGVVRVTVDRVVRAQARKVLRPFRLTADQRTSTPYFVHVRVANVGPSDLSGVVLPLYVRDSLGDLVQSTAVEDTFAPCAPHALPAPFAAGASARGCLIFLLPKGAAYDRVEFVPPAGVAPLVWAGTPETLGGGRKG